MKPNIPVHYQKGNTLQKGNPHSQHTTPSHCPPPKFLFLYHMDYNSVTRKDYTPTLPPPPPPPIFIFKFYFICTNIVLQEKIIPL